jgi:hypothetical protein
MSWFRDRLRAFAAALALPARALGLALAPRPALAAHGFDACTGEIDTVPFTIAASGTWCLKKDLTTTNAFGAAITVDANDVTVACNGFSVKNTAVGSPNNSNGVLVVDRMHVTVRDCRFDGFDIGVNIYGQKATSRGHLVERNRMDHSRTAGISLRGDDSVVRDNQLHETGGFDSGVYALQVDYTVDVIGNVVERVTSIQGDAVGIFVGSQASRSSVIGNRVRGLSSGPNGGRIGISVQTTGSEGNAIRGNDIANAGPFIATDRGIYCYSNINGARDNQINGFPIGVMSCRDDGGNVLVP